MRKLILILCLVSSYTFLAAQEKGNGRITGVVKDSSNDQPVEFAAVSLLDPATGKPVDGNVCDDKGKFTINKVAAGSYKISVTFIGYDSQDIPVTLNGNNHNIDLGTIRLNPKTEVLKEVTVEGQKPLIEEKVDRTVYNAENDATTRGGDATDVLKRVPMLSVDLDGNLSMRGNSNIRVLINNRPSTITASSIADALKQIPADEIKSVEVITSPSAKYDAEGSAGIVNIITKKNVLQGATLNINSGVGNRGANLGLNGSYKKGKLGLSLGGFGRSSYNVKGSFENRQVTLDDGVESINLQKADTRSNSIFGRYNLGIDYDLNKNNYLNASIQYGVRNNKSYQDDLLTQKFQEGSLLESNLRNVSTLNNSGNIDLNLGYTHLYEKPQKEFSVLAMYSRNDRDNNFLNKQYDDATNTLEQRLKNNNNSLNEEITLQADFQSPLGKTQMLEMGAKQIMRKVSSDYQYYQADGSDGEYIPLPDLTNVFNYDQDISSGYLSYTLNFLSNYTIKAGTRYEYTTIKAHFQGEQDIDIPSYGVLVPSINASKKFKNGNMLKASYNRRIQRPSIQYLNPNLQQTNQLSQSIGNPSLDPEYTNNYELGYNAYIKSTSLNISGFVRNTNNSIQSVREVINQDTILTRYQNIGQEDAYGVSVFANVSLGKFTLNGGSDLYYAVLNNNNPDPNYHASNEGWVIGGRIFGGYELSKGWGIQFFSFYRGRQVQLQGTQGGFGVYSLGIKKDIGEDKRGNIGFGAENFFTPNFKVKSNTSSPFIDQQSTNIMKTMNFKINFSYRIGKISANPNQGRKRNKKSINNDDLKDNGGGGDDQGGGDMQRGGNSGGGQRQQGKQSVTTPNK